MQSLIHADPIIDPSMFTKVFIYIYNIIYKYILIILYYMILYYIILYYIIILYHIILYSILLYCIVLYCIIYIAKAAYVVGFGLNTRRCWKFFAPMWIHTATREPRRVFTIEDPVVRLLHSLTPIEAKI